MNRSLRLFRVAGIDVRVHWSFVLILIWGAFLYSPRSGSMLTGALYGVVVMLLLFLCVTLHEFGHAVAARRYGIGVPLIMLLPIGGVATLERNPETPTQELVISFAGPLVNIILVAVFYPLASAAAYLTGQPVLALNPAQWLSQSFQIGLSNLLYYLAGVNLLLALFNLLPAFPLDGGRVLRAALAYRLPLLTATRIAVWVGRGLALLLAAAGLLTGNFLMLFIVFFIFTGGGAEQQAIQSRQLLQGKRAADVLAPNAVRVYVSESLQHALDLVVSTRQTHFAVFDLANHFVGALTRNEIMEAMQSSGDDQRIMQVMRPAAQIPTVQKNDELDTVLDVFMQSGSEIVVVREINQFAGIISVDDLAQVIETLTASARTPNAINPIPMRRDARETNALTKRSASDSEEST